MSVNSVQGLQNQIFAIFLLLTIFTNLDQQIISQYLGYRTISETREAPVANIQLACVCLIQPFGRDGVADTDGSGHFCLLVLSNRDVPQWWS